MGKNGLKKVILWHRYIRPKWGEGSECGWQLKANYWLKNSFTPYLSNFPVNSIDKKHESFHRNLYAISILCCYFWSKQKSNWHFGSLVCLKYRNDCSCLTVFIKEFCVAHMQDPSDLLLIEFLPIFLYYWKGCSYDTKNYLFHDRPKYRLNFFLIKSMEYWLIIAFDRHGLYFICKVITSKHSWITVVYKFPNG